VTRIVDVPVPEPVAVRTGLMFQSAVPVPVPVLLAVLTAARTTVIVDVPVPEPVAVRR
jgi:hypothetical protein